MTKLIYRLWPYLFVLLALIITAVYSQYLTLNHLTPFRHHLQAWQHNTPYTSLTLFLVINFLVTVLCLPLSAILSILCGWLFGMYQATIMIIFSATLGSWLSYYCARYSIFPLLQANRKKQSALEKMIAKNSWQTCWLVRLCPIFPFALINTVCGALAIPLKIYLTTTAIGILPATLIYTYLGQQLDKLFTSQQNIDVVIQQHLMLPIGLLATLSIATWSIYLWIKTQQKQYS